MTEKKRVNIKFNTLFSHSPHIPMSVSVNHGYIKASYAFKAT